MKLSSRARYGVRAVFDIAFHQEGLATQLRDIAERQNIPPRFLEQIFLDLKRAGLVSSRRGPKGGYLLAQSPDEIRLGDIIRALEGPTVIADPDEEAGDATSRLVTHQVFTQLSKRIEKCFDEVTIHDLCDRGEALGVGRRARRRYVYAI